MQDFFVQWTRAVDHKTILILRQYGIAEVGVRGHSRDYLSPISYFYATNEWDFKSIKVPNQKLVKGACL